MGRKRENKTWRSTVPTARGELMVLEDGDERIRQWFGRSVMQSGMASDTPRLG